MDILLTLQQLHLFPPFQTSKDTQRGIVQRQGSPEKHPVLVIGQTKTVGNCENSRALLLVEASLCVRQPSLFLIIAEMHLNLCWPILSWQWFLHHVSKIWFFFLMRHSSQFFSNCREACTLWYMHALVLSCSQYDIRSKLKIKPKIF